VTVLLPGGIDARYVSTGHLVFVTNGELRAVPFDSNRLVVGENQVSVVPAVVQAVGAGEFSIAPDGTLAYVLPSAPGATENASVMVWVDRSGQESPLRAPPREYGYPRLSPDGTRIALSSADQERDVWIYDIKRGALSQLTFDSANDLNPIWTPNGRRVLFQSNRESAVPNIWSQAADGSDNPVRLAKSDVTQIPSSISPDGTALVLTQVTAGSGRDVMRMSLDGKQTLTPLLQTPNGESNGEVSPDGHWLAYQSDRSGREEIYVRPYPNTSAGQWEISSGGGIQPAWARGGRELFYLAPDGTMMSVAVEATAGAWVAAAPRKLFQGHYRTRGRVPPRMYDVTADGQRFLMLKPVGTDQSTVAPTIVVVQNFAQELKARVPKK
jgi:serine/threonine-protein kinase